MFFSRFRFSCVLDHDALLPVYKGSAFRGGFGHGLKQIVCTRRRQRSCDLCLLKETCIYVRVFEQSCEAGQTGRVRSKPHPFVIIPPLEKKTQYSRGSAFDFHLLLFGEVDQLLPYFIYAFEQMGKNGIGTRRAGFTLQKVVENSRTVYHADSGKVIRQKPQSIELAPLVPGNGQIRRVTVELQTPLRVKFKNKLQEGLPFHVLTRAMLRRMSSLFESYGNGEPDLDYKGLVKRASDVRIVENRLAWLDLKRFSSRQDASMLMGGITGSVTYEGAIDEFLPLIDLCSKINVGKQTTFGMGRIRFYVTN